MTNVVRMNSFGLAKIFAFKYNLCKGLCAFLGMDFFCEISVLISPAVSCLNMIKISSIGPRHLWLDCLPLGIFLCHSWTERPLRSSSDDSISSSYSHSPYLCGVSLRPHKGLPSCFFDDFWNMSGWSWGTSNGSAKHLQLFRAVRVFVTRHPLQSRWQDQRWHETWSAHLQFQRVEISLMEITEWISMCHYSPSRGG